MAVAPAVTETTYFLTVANLGPFPTVWPYAAAADVAAYLDNQDGLGPRALAQPGQFTVSSPDPLAIGGNVMLSVALLTAGMWPAGAMLSLVRVTSNGQPSVFGEDLAFSPAACEAALDNVERQVQELRSAMRRTISVSYGESGGTLPPADERAGMYLGFDAEGKPIMLPGTGGADDALRADLADPDAGASLVAFRANAAGAVSRTVMNVLRDQGVRPEQFGAVGDAGTGDTSDSNALDAMTAYAITAGRNIILSRPYRITRPWKIGGSVLNDLAFLMDRANVVDAGLAPIGSGGHFDVAAYNANFAAYQNVSIVCEGAAAIIVDFTASVPTAAVEYNLPLERPDAGIVGTLRVIHRSLFAGGKYTRPAPIHPTNNLAGLLVYGAGLGFIDNLFFAGLETGLLAASCYWLQLHRARYEYCGTGINIADGNAMRLGLTVGWYSGRGGVIDGAQTDWGSWHTEQVVEDIWLLRADGGSIGPAYLEDDGDALGGGAGKYGVRFGVTSGVASQVIGVNVRGVRVNPVRTGKRAYRIWGMDEGRFEGSREYSNGVDTDNVSNAHLENTDFLVNAAMLPGFRFGRIANGRYQLTSDFPAPAAMFVIGEYPVNLVGVTPGSIAAGGTVDVDVAIVALPTHTMGFGPVRITSAGDDRIIVKAFTIDTTHIRVRSTNPTAGAITPGAMNLTVDLKLFL